MGSGYPLPTHTHSSLQNPETLIIEFTPSFTSTLHLLKHCVKGLYYTVKYAIWELVRSHFVFTNDLEVSGKLKKICGCKLSKLLGYFLLLILISPLKNGAIIISGRDLFNFRPELMLRDDADADDMTYLVLTLSLPWPYLVLTLSLSLPCPFRSGFV